ncbi:hypothetical protein CUJ89_03910 [Burkholderia pyrrocinia]|uniref:DUF4214 domain-containing protein n=1 Tax=Burkholderia pyrrocinia TaxID=60550 RepID=A0A2Z5MR31_BURPY|nr:DUF4214 domain-containing protein [Burkholderia pyrrocinia]AXF19743.1 hypothetical protein CUJ89_03910 [Burkholderia pyrrocinia]
MQPTEIAHFKNRIRQVVAKQADRILHAKLEKAVSPTHVHAGGPASIAPDIERIKQIAIELRGAVHASGGAHHHATLEPHPLSPLPSVSIPARFDLAYPALPTFPSFVDFFDESDERFLHRLFTHLLHREPDEAGLEHLLEQLQSGDSQLEVLLHIWASRERKLLGTQLAGIRRAKRLLFLSNLPVIGPRIKSKLGRSISGKKPIQFSATTLQQYEDEGFVRSAYRVILKREPDTQGLRDYLNQLRSGISKVKIIQDMRASREGHEAATVLHDIAYPSMVETLEVIPVIRWIAFPFIVHYRTYRVAKLAKLANSALIAHANARATAADSAFQRILIAIGERDQVSNIQACITRDAITSLQGSIDATSRMIAESAKRSPWIAYDERIRKLEKKIQPDHDLHARLAKLEDVASRSDDIHRVVFSTLEDSRKTSKAFALELKSEIDLLRQDVFDTTRVVSAAVDETPSTAHGTSGATSRMQSARPDRLGLPEGDFDSTSATHDRTLATLLDFIAENNGVRDSEIEMLQQSVDVLRSNVDHIVKERKRSAEQPQWIVYDERLRALENKIGRIEQRVHRTNHFRESSNSTEQAQLLAIARQLDSFKQSLDDTLTKISVAADSRSGSGQTKATVGHADDEATRQVLRDTPPEVLGKIEKIRFPQQNSRQFAGHETPISQSDRSTSQRDLSTEYQIAAVLSDELHQTRNKLTDLFEEMRASRSGDLDSDQLARLDSIKNGYFQSLYHDFETKFRGARSLISSRQKLYLPWIEASIANTKTKRILDLGCGRGEWLSLLRAENHDVIGVDVSPNTNNANLKTVQSDAIAYLMDCANASCSVITSFHMIEHMAPASQLELLKEAMRVLEPGGMLILETPNPENMIVGASNFYLDPTHKRPIPPQLLQLLFEENGFVDVQSVRLHPNTELHTQLSPVSNQLANLLAGPQDYAVIGKKAKKQA